MKTEITTETAAHQVFEFQSVERTYIADITEQMYDFVRRVDPRIDRIGRFEVRTGHTTCGFVVTELNEPKFKEDLIRCSLELVPEDERGVWARVPKPPFNVPQTDIWQHNCEDNPNLPKDQIDKDHNAARHLRAALFSSPQVSLLYDCNGLNLGTFQRLGFWEFDGRDGTDGLGSKPNPSRSREILASVYPANLELWLEPATLKL